METLLNPKETKARKRHTCNFCGDRIIINQIYMKSTHVYDGMIYDWKTHKYCSELARRLNMYDECDEGVTQDDFMESVSEEHIGILSQQLPRIDSDKFGDIIGQLSKVEFESKLWFVIRYYSKIDKGGEAKQTLQL